MKVRGIVSPMREQIAGKSKNSPSPSPSPSYKRIASQRGFTIVELLVVIVVIAILAAISIVAYTGIQNRARESAIASKEAQVKKKLEVYKVENDAYPTDQDAFDTLISQTPTDQYYTTYTSAPPHDTYSISTAGGSGSVALTCPTGFIVVPGNSHYGTSDFCVMKYEAKNVGGTATSQATDNPWVSISQTSAITTAQGACSGCKLITEAEWMTIAMNAISVPSNWVSGTVGSGTMYRGHSDNNPANALAASANDSDGYTGTGQSSGEQRRTLTLTNGEVIWDFAGNVYEWTDATITGGQPGLSGESAYAWKDYNAGSLQWNSLPSNSRPTGTLYPRSQGVGGLYSNAAESGARAFLRGGSWNGGGSAGVLAVNLSTSPSNTNTPIGFRVSR
jgi:type II secretion system protein G